MVARETTPALLAGGNPADSGTEVVDLHPRAINATGVRQCGEIGRVIGVARGAESLSAIMVGIVSQGKDTDVIASGDRGES